jgi:hypothetical protein
MTLDQLKVILRVALEAFLRQEGDPKYPENLLREGLERRGVWW